jgi:glycosyltransferase involved in cell wall biosynthesis
MEAIALGRSTPKKRYRTMIEGVAIAVSRGAELNLRIYAPATTESERQHRLELGALIDELAVQDHVRLMDGVPPADIPALLASSDVLINSTEAGSGDKAVFEAMAMGRAVLVSNPSFRELLADLPLPLQFEPDDASDLAAALNGVASASPETLRKTAIELRSRIERGHSIETWARGIVRLVAADR